MLPANKSTPSMKHAWPSGGAMGPTTRKGLQSSWDAGASGILSHLLADKLKLMSLAINFVINGGYGDASEVLNLHSPLYQH